MGRTSGTGNGTDLFVIFFVKIFFSKKKNDKKEKKRKTTRAENGHPRRPPFWRFLCGGRHLGAFLCGGQKNKNKQKKEKKTHFGLFLKLSFLIPFIKKKFLPSFFFSSNQFQFNENGRNNSRRIKRNEIT